MPVTIVCKRCNDPFQARTKHRRYCDGCGYPVRESESQAIRRAAYSPERKRAAHLVATAILNGSLIRQPCEVCGKRNVHAHHDDYSKPLDIRWLCPSHHKQHHLRHGKGIAA